MTPSWKSLPPEIRLLILRCIIPQHRLKRTITDRGFPRASLLATVSKEWRCFFERETFRRMDLEATDLHNFTKNVGGKNVIRLNYITNVLLTIKLATYTRRIADKPESGTTATQNNRTFTKAMAVLLNTLSHWEGQTRGGLLLEIRMYSPSDRLFHGNLMQLYDDYPLRFEDDPQLLTTFMRFCRRNKTRFKSFRAAQRSLDVVGRTKRLHGTPLELKPSLVKKQHFCSKTLRNLPKAPVVKGLILRGDCRKSIAVKTLTTLFRECFVALESFNFVRWCGFTEEQETTFLNDLRGGLMPAFPASLQRFVFHIRRDYGRYLPDRSDFVPDALSTLLAHACHNFTQFCLPNDGVSSRLSFWDELMRVDGRESKLQSLAFKTRYLGHNSSQLAVTEFLIFISVTVKRLPALRTLELWSASDGFGCLFRCTLDDFRVKITWRCTDDRFTLQEEAVRYWAHMASNRPFEVIKVPLTKSIEFNPMFKLSTMLRGLQLRQLSFDPIYEAHTRLAEKMDVGTLFGVE
ncbi:hypothetical protein FPOAC2_02189 [Fusarium poae]|uniref:DUF6546 domain-containing protein n=1 Tax=Fusarium poae TaxID=36050 RepID=A0A1B8B5S3_FUSPO|nr:hypothetical protein FPOA_02012 [Fusarium poae]